MKKNVGGMADLLPPTLPITASYSIDDIDSRH